jgi:S1-C subfamily serine protease
VGLAQPQAEPIQARVLIVVPNRSAVSRVVTGDAAEAVWRREYDLGSAIVSSRAFQSATFVERADTRQPDPAGAQFVIWYRLESGTAADASKGWYIRKDDLAPPTAIPLDPGAAAGPGRTAAFLKSLRETALKLGATTTKPPASVQASGAQPARSPVPAAPTARTYTYNDKQYTSLDAVLAARRADIDSNIKAVPKDTEPVKGRARIVLADRDRLRALYPNRTAADLNLLVEFSHISEQEVVDALRRAGTFERVSVVEQNDTTNPEPGDDDYVIFYQVRSTGANNVGTWTAGWRVRRKGSPAVIPVGFDPGVPVGGPRLAAFVKTVRQAAVNLGTRTPGVPGAVAGGPGSGSGFFINAAGQVVTNDHVVNACSTIRVLDTAKTARTATVVARDATNDLALLATGTAPKATARLRETRTVRAGESVVVTGFPLAGLVGSEMQVTTGTLTSLAGISDDTRIFQISAPVQPGNSGGPLLDGEGNVIGVVSATLNALRVAVATGGAIPQNVNFAIKSSVLRNFLEANNVDFASIAERPAHDLQAPDIADIGRTFTVKVVCEKAAPTPAAPKP